MANSKLLECSHFFKTLYQVDVDLMIVTRPVEMKKILGGATKFEILSATMAGRQREFLISDCLKVLEKFNICRRWVM